MLEAVQPENRASGPLKPTPTTSRFTGKTRTGHKHRGAISEIAASAWLLEEGYEVFRNVSSAGPIDIVAIRGAETIRVDVKTAYRDKYGKLLCHNKARAPGIRVLLVIASTNEVLWAPE